MSVKISNILTDYINELNNNCLTNIFTCENKLYTDETLIAEELI